MTYRGRIKDGKVVLEGPEFPPEGAEVLVDIVEPPAAPKATPRGGRFRTCAGMIKDLPSDFSTNIDHYLYGTQKEE